MYVTSGVGQKLIELERSGFKCSEGDPLLKLLVDVDNYVVSKAYPKTGGGRFLPT